MTGPIMAEPVGSEAFRPCPVLGHAHLQAIWANLVRTPPSIRYRREALPAPDGEILYLDHLDPHGERAAGMRLLLLHGLEGSSQAIYIRSLAAIAAVRGLPVTALNFRSCALPPDGRCDPIPVTRPRFYHSGETADFDHVVKVLRVREPGDRLLAMGVSLGGNVLLKWLGEDPRGHRLEGAATLSVPYDLQAGSRNLRRGLNRMYVWRFFGSLKRKAHRFVVDFARHAGALDLDRILAASDFEAFDDAFTAPVHGFRGAKDYYARSSSIEYVSSIRVPSLIISAADDPFLGPGVLDELRRRIPAAVRLEVSPGGGHVGFVSHFRRGTFPTWAEERLGRFLDEFLRPGTTGS